MLPYDKTETDLGALGKLPQVDPPTMGRYFTPLDHRVLVEAIEKNFKRYQLGPARFSLTPDGADFACCWDLLGCETIIPNSKLAVAVVNSNLQRFPLYAYFGVRLDSGIGIVLGRARLGKHTQRNLKRLPERMGEPLIKMFETRVSRFKNTYDTMLGTEIPPAAFDYYLTAAGRKHLLSWGRLNYIDQEIRAKDKPNYWDLLVAFCDTVRKSRPVVGQLAQMFGFFSLVDQVKGGNRKGRHPDAPRREHMKRIQRDAKKKRDAERAQAG